MPATAAIASTFCRAQDSGRTGGRPAAAWRPLDGNFVVAPGRHETEGFQDQPDRAPKRRPVIGAEFEDGNPQATKPVLMPDILVRRDQNVEPVPLGSPEEIAVAQLMPTHLKGVPDFDVGENRLQTARDAVIEKDAQAK